MQVEGVIMPPDGPDCWPEKDSKRQWLVFYELEGMTLGGGGTMEGNGEEWWKLPCKPHRVCVLPQIHVKHHQNEILRSSRCC